LSSRRRAADVTTRANHVAPTLAEQADAETDDYEFDDDLDANDDDDDDDDSRGSQ
jgi:hypothetical protein